MEQKSKIPQLQQACGHTFEGLTLIQLSSADASVPTGHGLHPMLLEVGAVMQVSSK